MRVAFLLQDLQLSGGVGAVVEHAAGLRRDHAVDAQLVLIRPQEHPDWPHRGLAEVPTVTLADALQGEWDVAVATTWPTAAVLFELRARRHAAFLQRLEDSAYPAGAPERIAAGMVTSLPIRFLTPARALAALLEDLQPGNAVFRVPHGVDQDVFSGAARGGAPDGGPLRVVVEGARDDPREGIDAALAALALMREPAHVTWVSPRPAVAPAGVDRTLAAIPARAMAELLGESDVLLRLPHAEGMAMAPLEALHCGAAVVTAGDEAVEHRGNGLIVGADDSHGTARALDLLARDRTLLGELRAGALRTAAAWPDWAQASAAMAGALRAIADEPEPAIAPAGRRLVSDFSSATADAQLARRRLDDALAAYDRLAAERTLGNLVRGRARAEAGRVRRRLGASKRRAQGLLKR